jgi:imidazolonepropionase-like amidohydrolase
VIKRIAICGLLLALAPAAQVGAQGAPQLVLSGVTIVDTHNGKLTPDMAIVIASGKIVKIVRAGSLAANSAAKVVDARGKFVVPGYLDMHSHALTSNDPDDALTLMVANGITGYRQMSGAPELLAARRAGKLLGPVGGPELLAMPGTILTHVNALNPQAAIAEVDRQKADGADFIKVIELTAPAFVAVSGEANRLGIPFLGHLNENVAPLDAAKAGMHSIEHLGPNSSVLLSCSTDEAALRQAIAQAPARPPAPPPVSAPGAGPSLAEQATADPIAFSDGAEFKIMQRILETYSDEKCRKLAATFVADKTWQVPTLIRIRTMQINDDPAYRNSPNLKYELPATAHMWALVGGQFTQRVPATSRETLRNFFDLQLKLTKLYAEIGVGLMAGTDSGGSASWTIPGFALHQEFDLLAEAGLSPLQVLQTTTLNGARFLGREATMGSVEVGKNADLVLLDANPLASVQNMHRIDAVVNRGTWYSRAGLNAIEKNVADRYARG